MSRASVTRSRKGGQHLSACPRMRGNGAETSQGGIETGGRPHSSRMAPSESSPSSRTRRERSQGSSLRQQAPVPDQDDPFEPEALLELHHLVRDGVRVGSESTATTAHRRASETASTPTFRAAATPPKRSRRWCDLDSRSSDFAESWRRWIRGTSSPGTCSSGQAFEERIGCRGTGLSAAHRRTRICTRSATPGSHWGRTSHGSVRLQVPDGGPPPPRHCRGTRRSRTRA